MNNYPNFFVNDSEKERVVLTDGQWVEIKAEMSIGDWEKYDEAGLEYKIADQDDNGTDRASRRRRFKGSSSQQDASLKIKSGFISLVHINLVAWSFELPMTPQVIGKLKPIWIDIIIERIEALNPTNPLVSSGLTALSSSTRTTSKEDESTSPTLPSDT